MSLSNFATVPLGRGAELELLRTASRWLTTAPLGALQADTRLVDVRSPQEFSGELVATLGYENAGAARRPHPRVTGSDGEIIAYCRIGERSAHTRFVLHELRGRPQVKNYDGAGMGWGNRVRARGEGT